MKVRRPDLLGRKLDRDAFISLSYRWNTSAQRQPSKCKPAGLSSKFLLRWVFSYVSVRVSATPTVTLQLRPCTSMRRLQYVDNQSSPTFHQPGFLHTRRATEAYGSIMSLSTFFRKGQLIANIPQDGDDKRSADMTHTKRE